MSGTYFPSSRFLMGNLFPRSLVLASISYKKSTSATLFGILMSSTSLYAFLITDNSGDRHRYLIGYTLSSKK
ncbi:hypothetical protein GUJ93_ZPchr0005g15631 [Zizania palustris]|uniref:Uncharacterized protein n=1 Tax=Zizania palustris TaxID=103762 RepID=A0A8J5VRJ7_ZIZPA|nr:hypothetical protein GUJ93_ZPchr0005g15631 [Zizania palustris]